METTVQINSSDNSEHTRSQNKHRNEVNIKGDEMKIQTATSAGKLPNSSSTQFPPTIYNTFLRKVRKFDFNLNFE